MAGKLIDYVSNVLKRIACLVRSEKDLLVSYALIVVSIFLLTSSIIAFPEIYFFAVSFFVFSVLTCIRFPIRILVSLLYEYSVSNNAKQCLACLIYLIAAELMLFIYLGYFTCICHALPFAVEGAIMALYCFCILHGILRKRPNEIALPALLIVVAIKDPVFSLVALTTFVIVVATLDGLSKGVPL